METEFSVDFQLIWYHLYQLGIAFALTLPIAFDRELKSEGAGLRTFPLVAVSTAAFMLVANDVYQDPEAQARVMYGVITGIGFIGGGSIIKESGTTHGTATAAGIWLTGAIGVSVAYQRYEIAIVLSLIGFVLLHFMEPYKRKLKRSQSD
ncbi:MgtC/SapB family protein [Alteromonas oceanisediminis]|uniref:MgtC/SapB family protein n=1 Tax=Alteromonas oceanisediminis TaxID=2836180 RepID=UPI001BDAFCAD|nr:MgtC/SapB family protein [Alteromonas oceanisediminis]MBT0584888.1 MgtC/SapB family protein [Alteromonas oceanisediminis]